MDLKLFSKLAATEANSPIMFRVVPHSLKLLMMNSVTVLPASKGYVKIDRRMLSRAINSYFIDNGKAKEQFVVAMFKDCIKL